jgi:hypothetical protein
VPGPNASLNRVRSAALVAAVAALLTSVGTTAARAEGPAPARVDTVVLDTVAASRTLSPGLSSARGWAVGIPR